MNQTNKEAFREFARGVSTIIAVLAVCALTVAIWSPREPQDNPKFKVVDNYKQCDVVRYTDQSNRWHYFLDCSGNRP